jgi:CRP-like cAMP-binding protein
VGGRLKSDRLKSDRLKSGRLTVPLLERKPRAATVTTVESTSLLVITTGNFNSLVAIVPSVDRKMLVVLAERLRDVEACFVPAESRVASTELACP